MNGPGGPLRRAAAGAIGLACGLALLGATLAQSSTGLPASLISGSCAQPGAVAAPLANAGLTVTEKTTPAAGGLSPSSAPVIPVMTSVTTVSMKLSDLLDGAHAISVAQGVAQPNSAAVCGNLGKGSGGADTIVGLASAQGSRYAGIAWLHPVGDQTQVTVFVEQNIAGSGGGGENDNG
jgi:hypothetical protein